MILILQSYLFKLCTDNWKWWWTFFSLLLLSLSYFVKWEKSILYVLPFLSLLIRGKYRYILKRKKTFNDEVSSYSFSPESYSFSKVTFIFLLLENLSNWFFFMHFELKIYIFLLKAQITPRRTRATFILFFPLFKTVLWFVFYFFTNAVFFLEMWDLIKKNRVHIIQWDSCWFHQIISWKKKEVVTRISIWKIDTLAEGYTIDECCNLINVNVLHVNISGVHFLPKKT